MGRKKIIFFFQLQSLVGSLKKKNHSSLAQILRTFLLAQSFIIKYNQGRGGGGGVVVPDIIVFFFGKKVKKWFSKIAEIFHRTFEICKIDLVLDTK